MQEFVEETFAYLDLDWKGFVVIDDKLRRPAEVDYLQGDASKAKRILGYEVKTKFLDLIRLMVDAEMEEYEKS